MWGKKAVRASTKYHPKGGGRLKPIFGKETKAAYRVLLLERQLFIITFLPTEPKRAKSKGFQTLPKKILLG
jgi:hypothetical protein